MSARTQDTSLVLLTLAPTYPVLLVGWSFLGGVGAALILPAIVALVALFLSGRIPKAPPGAEPVPQEA